jgi:hypothetical protein
MTRLPPLLLALTAAAGCGAEAPLRCGTPDNPAVLHVGRRSPALGATVKNRAIEESFTVEGSPIYLELPPYPFSVLEETPAHTAGYVGYQSATQWSSGVADGDVTIARTVDAWSEAPGHVELAVIVGWQSEQGCYYRLPDPILSYDVTPNSL